jgi:hypothetical protein
MMSVPVIRPRDELTNSMKQDSSSRSATQEIHRLLWNPKFRFRVDKNPSMVHILSQMKTVRILPHNSFKIHFNIILLPLSSLLCNLNAKIPRRSLRLPIEDHLQSLTVS